MILALILAAVMALEGFQPASQPVLSVSDDVAAAVHDIRVAFDGEQYPDDYGGFYYSDDKTTVVLCCVEETERYTGLAQAHSCIRLEAVEYSLEELHQMVPAVEEALLILGFDEGTAVWVEEQRNAVAVRLPDGRHTLDDFCAVRRQAGGCPLYFETRAYEATIL